MRCSIYRLFCSLERVFARGQDRTLNDHMKPSTLFIVLLAPVGLALTALAITSHQSPGCSALGESMPIDCLSRLSRNSAGYLRDLPAKLSFPSNLIATSRPELK
jgi:hypothetical protein